MTAAKMIVAALMLPALILTGVIAAVIWILRARRRSRPQSTRGRLAVSRRRVGRSDRMDP